MKHPKRELGNGSSSWKIVAADKNGKVRLHLKPPVLEQNSQTQIPEDVTPRTGLLMKLFNQAQPLVRSYQAWLDGNMDKAMKILASPKKADELFLLGILKWQSGDLEKAEECFREGMLSKSEIGVSFRRYSIPMQLEVNSNPESEDDNIVFFIIPGQSFISLIYACICIEMEKSFIGFQQLKSYSLLHPEDHIFLLGLTALLDQLGSKEAEAKSFYVGLTEKLEKKDTVSHYLILQKAKTQFGLGRYFPALETLNQIAVENPKTKLDAESLHLQSLAFEKTGKDREAKACLLKIESMNAAESKNTS